MQFTVEDEPVTKPCTLLLEPKVNFLLESSTADESRGSYLLVDREASSDAEE